MSVLVVGVSHASASVATLERAVVTGEPMLKLLRDVSTAENIAGALVLSTCNRIEIYAEVNRFHGGVASICDLLARHSGLPLAELTAAAYVHYEDRAVAHMLAVACGLDSMVVGESQILGQLRAAVNLARDNQTMGRELSNLARAALRTAKRAHAETAIDSAGRDVVTVGFAAVADAMGRQTGPDAALAGLSLLVVGAGSISALTVATAARQGATRVVIANRTRARAERLAESYGAAVTSLSDLPAAIAAADLVVTCTGAVGPVLTESIVGRALALRPPDSQPLALLDLALPRDVEPSVASMPGVRLIDLEAMNSAGQALAPGGVTDSSVEAVKAIVARELDEYLKADRAISVAPTVVALRAKAATVVETELARLERRLGELDERTRREIAHAMGRIADKLLHGPTVRVKELASAPGGESYETALRVLFELDPDAIEAVGRPDRNMLAWAQEGTDK